MLFVSTDPSHLLEKIKYYLAGGWGWGQVRTNPFAVARVDRTTMRTFVNIFDQLLL